MTLSPGLTVTLRDESVTGQAATITIANDSTELASAFANFAQAYNSASDAIAAQRGTNSGALQGDSILQTLSGVLNHLGNYSDGSAASALANFGVTVGRDGHLSVDTAAFALAAASNFQQLLSTLGTQSTGGFLKSASDLISGVQNETAGILHARELSVSDQITSQKTKIVAQQETITQLQTNLTAQISRADAAIALLESKVSYVKGLFASYNGTSTTTR